MPASDQTVLIATGAALVGVIAGFFGMLHLAGGAAGGAAGGTKSNPLPNPLKAQAQIRHDGWSYKAVVRHWGRGTGTDYYRYDGAWRPISWDQMPSAAYRKLRAALWADHRRGPAMENPVRACKGTMRAPVGSPRQRSFCARMCGAKRINTGVATRNDPNSCINQSLRRWKCRC
jgi:hypothetical protein